MIGPQATRAEPGNIRFDWSRSLDDPTVYVLVEAFRDGAAGAAHVQSNQFTIATAALPQFLVETPRITSQMIDQDDWSELGEMTVGWTIRPAVQDASGIPRAQRRASTGRSGVRVERLADASSKSSDASSRQSAGSRVRHVDLAGEPGQLFGAGRMPMSAPVASPQPQRCSVVGIEPQG